MVVASQDLNPGHLILELLNLATWIVVPPHHVGIMYGSFFFFFFKTGIYLFKRLQNIILNDYTDIGLESRL